MPKKRWSKRAGMYESLADAFHKFSPGASKRFKQKAEKLRKHRGRIPKQHDSEVQE